jgi:hypothetical protein
MQSLIAHEERASILVKAPHDIYFDKQRGNFGAANTSLYLFWTSKLSKGSFDRTSDFVRV